MTSIAYLTAIDFDFGALARLPEAVAALGGTRPLLVTDEGLVAAGLAQRALDALAGYEVAVFDATPPNPTEAAVEAALAVWRERGCDIAVALGGGSAIDLAKGVALMATHPAPLAQYAAVLGGMAKITGAVAPTIAVPTTAGTGSEVGRAALLTLRDGRKLGFIAPHMIPKRAICDPELTLGLPPGLTAATGMDALTHCVETFLSPRVNPPADAIALDGAGRAWRWIETAVAEPDNRQARWETMMASLEGGLTFQKGLGAVHAMSHPLGGLAAPVLHHGTLNAVILPAVLRFNAGHVGDKIGRLCAALGLSADADLADEVAALNRRLGLPAGLREMGFDPALIPRMAEGALADHSGATNPRPTDRADYERLFAESL